MNWREATLSQLYEIAFHDRECAVQYKFDALNEIRRRKEAQKARGNGILQVKIRRKRA